MVGLESGGVRGLGWPVRGRDLEHGGQNGGRNGAPGATGDGIPDSESQAQELDP